MESISVLDMFKIGVGPSSSHTLGPWKSAIRFLNKLGDRIAQAEKIEIHLYGSLAKTGKGHGTDIAVQLGLTGADPVTFNVKAIDSAIEQIRQSKSIALYGEKQISFDPERDVHFLKDEILPFHPNALTFLCTLEDSTLVKSTYYSVGGGFVVKESGDR